MTLCLFAIPAGVWLGWRFHARLDQRQIYRICYSLLVATALKLLWDGVSGYSGEVMTTSHLQTPLPLVSATNDNWTARGAKPATGRSLTVDLLIGNENRLLRVINRYRGLLAMPIRQYFSWVGSILLVALLAADWLLPAPVAHPDSQIPPNERVNLRIRSDHKWPERVVLDTARSERSFAAKADSDDQPQDLGMSERRGQLNALAVMGPAHAAAEATNAKDSAIRARPQPVKLRMTGTIQAD
jgi:hypothetical protein